MQHHKMFCRISAPRNNWESEIFLKSETLHLLCSALLLSGWCRELPWEKSIIAHQSFLRSRWNSTMSSKEWESGKSRDQNSGLGNKSERTICHVPLQESMFFWGFFWVILPMISQNLCLCLYLWGIFQFVCMEVLYDFLEFFGAGGCRSDIHAPFSRCNLSIISLWLFSAKDYTWGMAVGTLINSCFQVTAAHSLYQFPRVLLRMCRKLRAREKSIHFIIVGEKILQMEQTESHWRTMRLKGRN